MKVKWLPATEGAVEDEQAAVKIQAAKLAVMTTPSRLGKLR
jgi:hypothetical protein